LSYGSERKIFTPQLKKEEEVIKEDRLIGNKLGSSEREILNKEKEKDLLRNKESKKNDPENFDLNNPLSL
jgi:hypothetical protein